MHSEILAAAKDQIKEIQNAFSLINSEFEGELMDSERILTMVLASICTLMARMKKTKLRVVCFINLVAPVRSGLEMALLSLEWNATRNPLPQTSVSRESLQSHIASNEWPTNP